MGLLLIILNEYVRIYTKSNFNKTIGRIIVSKSGF